MPSLGNSSSCELLFVTLHADSFAEGELPESKVGAILAARANWSNFEFLLNELGPSSQ